MPDDELTLKLLRHIEKTPNQKSLAKKLGTSVGKANYVLKALMEKGWVKMEKFFASENKRGYVYLLTREGVRAKIELTERFIEIKKKEYEELLREYERFRDLGKSDDQHRSLRRKHDGVCQ